MERKEMETVGMLQGSKMTLIEQGHPVIRLLREIPELIFPDETEKLPPSAIPLKTLFTRKQMDENHVDCLILYRIALRVLHILTALSRRGICAGLMDIGDFYVELGAADLPVYLIHPEKFQLLHFEQDYEWYPEDEKLFGDQTFFDADAQQKADVRLMYKILVASARGNVKIPPKYTEADYSELFYRTLPDEWKQIFAGESAVDYAGMERLLLQCIEMEEEFAGEAKNRINAREEQNVKEQVRSAPAEPSANKKQLFCMIVLLRTELSEAGLISKLLYQLQDQLETEGKLTGMQYRQAFVFGSGTVSVREFSSYPMGFRCQCEQQIKKYSCGEALMVAAGLMEETMDDETDRAQEENPAGEEYRMYVLADGRLKNDRMFQQAVSLIEKTQERGLIFTVITAGEESRCEACLRLKNLMNRRSDAGRRDEKTTESGR